MANLHINRVLKDSAAASLAALAKTATFNSEILNLTGYDMFGVSLDIGTVSGTSPTLDIKVQRRLDGTTWVDHYPQAENSETQATFAQITATKEVSKEWPIWPHEKIRLVFTIGGTSPSFTFTEARLVARRFGAGLY